MRSSLSVLAAAACLSACSGERVTVDSTGAFLRADVPDAIYNGFPAGTDPSSPACGTVSQRVPVEELAGVGTRVVQGVTTVTGRDGTVQAARVSALDVAVAPRGTSSVTIRQDLCAPRTAFPLRLDTVLLARDARGNEQRLAIALSVPLF